LKSSGDDKIVNDDIKTIRREMQNYIRSIWTMKQLKNRNDPLDILD